MIQTTADLEIEQIELHDLLSRENMNVNTVDSKIEKIGQLRTKMLEDHREELKKELTAVEEYIQQLKSK